MHRSRVVLDLLAARQAARQTGGPQLQAKSQPITSIRNRPALHTSSSPKVQSRPFHRQDVPTTAPTVKTSGAQSILARLQARKERLAAAASSSDKASIPGNHETRTTLRQRRATRPTGGASSEKLAPRQPLNAHRARQLPPVVEKLNKSTRQVSSASSVMTGSSFSFIAPAVVAQVAPSPRPSTPNAPRAARFHNVNNSAPVPFAIPIKSPEVPLRGILKRNGQHRVAARRRVVFAGELEQVRVVDRWIGVPCVNTPEKIVKKTDHVDPDPTRYLGKLRGWTGKYGSNGRADGQSSYVHGKEPIFQHSECGSPVCNKKGLHQFLGKYQFWLDTGGKKGGLKLEGMPNGLAPWEFNKAYDKYQQGKDPGSDFWMDLYLDEQ
ncbi:MAG: hypothetical protein Q9168_006934 [Polycauliona sp. 1 TL-2023]